MALLLSSHNSQKAFSETVLSLEELYIQNIALLTRSMFGKRKLCVTSRIPPRRLASRIHYTATSSSPNASPLANTNETSSHPLLSIYLLPVIPPLASKTSTQTDTTLTEHSLPPPQTSPNLPHRSIPTALTSPVKHCRPILLSYDLR